MLTKTPTYILLTPGPLSTTKSVRAAMSYDFCTWDHDYKVLVTEIRKKLLALAGCDPTRYTTVLMQGSGTFGVESVLGSSINRNEHKVLILANGVYGQRMVDMARILSLPYCLYQVDENEAFDPDVVRAHFEQDKKITHLAVVHCETTTGILNDIEQLADIARSYQKYFFIDAMSSFGGIELNVNKLGVDFLVSSANKCIQGVPGFSFVICKKEALLNLCKNQAKSLSLDLYGQWEEMEKHQGKWRYTSPTHVVLAFHQALCELNEEGHSARCTRYKENQTLLVEGMLFLGFKPYVPRALQSPIITSFIEPEFIPGRKIKFEFSAFYQYLKEHGFIIYPGKISKFNTFRIGSIGHIFPQDIDRLLNHIKTFIVSTQSA